MATMGQFIRCPILPCVALVLGLGPQLRQGLGLVLGQAFVWLLLVLVVMLPVHAAVKLLVNLVVMARGVGVGGAAAGVFPWW